MTDLGGVGAALIVIAIVGAVVYTAVQLLAPGHLLAAMGLTAVFGAGVVLMAVGDDDD